MGGKSVGYLTCFVAKHQGKVVMMETNTPITAYRPNDAVAEALELWLCDPPSSG